MLFKPVMDIRPSAYCGPSAIAILTGVPLSRIEKMIRRCRQGGYKSYDGRKIAIKGTYTWECLKVLKRLGCKVIKMKYTEGFLSKFVDDVRHAGTFLIEVTGHFMVCENGMVGDSSFHDPMPIENYHRGSRRVKQAWKVIAPTLPKYTAEDRICASRPVKPKRDIKEVRAEKVQKDIKRWERKEKLAKTKLKTLRTKLKRYETIGVINAS